MIDEFGRMIGLPVVMSSAFDLREEPVICSPKGAVRTDSSSGLDSLPIEPFLLSKQ